MKGPSGSRFSVEQHVDILLLFFLGAETSREAVRVVEQRLRLVLIQTGLALFAEEARERLVVHVPLPLFLFLSLYPRHPEKKPKF